MATVDFNKVRLTKLAAEFVRIYLEEGELAAGEWATNHIREDQYEEFRPYVHGEFIEQGYEVHEWMYD